MQDVGVRWPAALAPPRLPPTPLRPALKIVQTTYLSFTCGPASGGAAGGLQGGADATVAAAASALLSTLPCSKVPGVLGNPAVAEAAHQVAAFEEMLAAWGTKVRMRARGCEPQSAMHPVQRPAGQACYQPARKAS